MYEHGWYLGSKSLDKLTFAELRSALVLACEELGALRAVLHEWRQARRRHDLRQSDLHHGKQYETWPKHHLMPSDAGLPDEPDGVDPNPVCPPCNDPDAIARAKRAADLSVDPDPPYEEQERQRLVAVGNFYKQREARHFRAALDTGKIEALTPEQEKLLAETEPTAKNEERRIKEQVAALGGRVDMLATTIRGVSAQCNTFEHISDGTRANLDALTKRVDGIGAVLREHAYRLDELYRHSNEGAKWSHEVIKSLASFRDVNMIHEKSFAVHREMIVDLKKRLSEIDKWIAWVTQGCDPLNRPGCPAPATQPSPSPTAGHTDHGEQ